MQFKRFYWKNKLDKQLLDDASYQVSFKQYLANQHQSQTILATYHMQQILLKQFNNSISSPNNNIIQQTNNQFNIQSSSHNPKNN